MATQAPCANVEVRYKGTGTQKLFTFPFTYIRQSHIHVSLWDDTKKEYVEVPETGWGFANATTIEFTVAPPVPPSSSTFNVKISRRTSLDKIEAQFYPGSAIRAEDLNSDFDQLRLAIQENRCELYGTVTELLATRYWNKLSVTTPDDKGDTLTKVDQEEGRWVASSDKHIATSDAISARLDPYVQDTKPADLVAPKAEQAGKSWFDQEDLVERYWDPDADAWVTLANTGPEGPVGPSGGVSFKGNIDITLPPPSGVVAGDQFANVTQGNPVAGFTGLVGPIDVGDLVLFTGTRWVSQKIEAAVATGRIVRWRKTAVGAETVLTGKDDGSIDLSYVVGNEQVFINGALQQRGVDYNSPSPKSIEFTKALIAGDVVELHAVQGYVIPGVAVGSITDAEVSDTAAIKASKLSFTQAGTGAVARTVDSKLKDVVSVKDFGAVGDGVADDTAAIQAAINYASTAGKIVYFPAGTYKAVPATNQDWEGTPLGEGQIAAAFVMKSNMALYGEVGTTIKLADNCSTLAAPKRIALFFSNSQLSNLSFQGLTFDMNGLNNRISPAAPTTYNRFQQAAIHFSGTVSGTAARADNVVIDHCKFLNTAGVSCIVMAQSNSPSVVLGKNWSVTNCLFKNNGIDTDDHSSIFAWADNVVCSNNTFTADSMYPNGISGVSGSLVAYEVHGANQRFTNNLVSNYFQGLWVATNQTSAVDNVIISGNTLSPIKFAAIDFFRNSAVESAISKVLIDGNTIGLDDTVSPGVNPDLKTAVQLNTPYLIEDVQISNNICSKIGISKASAFVNFGTRGTVAGQKHDDIVIKNNLAKGFVIGVNISTSATNGMGYVEVSGNSFLNFSAQGAFAIPMGVSTAGPSPIDSLFIESNTCKAGAANFDYGAYLSGSITNLYVSNQKYVGMAVANYYETALTVVTRRGTFDKLPLTPNWQSGGAAVTVGNGSTLGYYIIHGDQVTVSAELTVGSTTTFVPGNLSIGLPIASAVAGLQYMGTWRIFDASAVNFTFGTAHVDGTALNAMLQVSGGTYATNGAPVVLAAGDVVSVQITYLRA